MFIIQCTTNWDKGWVGCWDVTPRGPGSEAPGKPRIHGVGSAAKQSMLKAWVLGLPINYATHGCGNLMGFVPNPSCQLSAKKCVN